MMSDGCAEGCAFLVFAVVAIGLYFMASAWIFTWLWNNTMPDLFGLPRLTYMQGLKLLGLFKVGTGALLGFLDIFLHVLRSC